MRPAAHLRRTAPQPAREREGKERCRYSNEIHHPEFSLWQSAVDQLGGPAKYCSTIAWEIAKAKVAGDKAAEAYWTERQDHFSTCDPRYAEAIHSYVQFRLKSETVPYKRRQEPDDEFYSHGYAIMDLTGATARVAYHRDSDAENSAMSFVDNLPSAAAAAS